ncbi:chromosome partitioning protein ParB [Steroidobacter denitrificans]|uniref:Probable chromosome-partitioning protein ParB n=1 Tax=Steroidobacter denitrificans TaxID=465721 RepID=A0A127FEN4_STEDE|nr:ParB/RepB/Spo0J family partition protein [Steroidobacter denitrificans]AMN48430.1 chromosome partitioning protein ParB [Steroidobacter denitrificans]
MATKRPSLGRPLGALLGQPAVGVAGTGVQRSDEELQKLPVDLLQRGKYQPRIDIRTESLQELADSIRAQGVIQPIVVRPLDDPGLQDRAPGQGGSVRRYEIIAGERRWRAAQLAGLHEIPAVIRRVPDQAAVAMALIENIQRENLNPLEEARALDRLIGEFEMTHASAAEAVGRSRAAVSNLLRLLELCDEVKRQVETRELEMGHARALLALENPRQQAQIGARIVQQKLSVRETEALVKRLRAQPSGKAARSAARADPNIRKLEGDLSEKLGAKVSVQHSGSGKGRLVISYHTLDELDGILAHIR